MSTHPKVTVFGYEPGRSKISCLVGDNHEAIPITIKGIRVPSTGKTIPGPSLWVRSATSPYYAFPYMLGGEVSVNVGGSGQNITLKTAADVNAFVAGDVVGWFDQSTGLVGANTNAAVVSSVDATTGIVALDQVLNTTITAKDILFVVSDATYGAQFVVASAKKQRNVCIVMEDIILASGQDQIAAGFIKGSFVRSKILNATWCPSGAAETARVTTYDGADDFIQLIDIVT